LRGAGGYWARYDGYAKFGATMEAGRDDVETDAGTVADLKARAARLAPEANLDAAVARAGVRAATPDGWPLIGRDAASGVLIASGMRRNGYVFAPLAARIVLDLIEGRPAEATYDPNRFVRR
jgi:glycine oxidase